jgi:hypothetical protein
MYIFNSRCQALTVVLKPSSRTFIGTELVKNPGLKAHFERGLFKTEDEEIATRLRKLIASGQEREVVELTNLDELFYKTKKQQNQRKSISAAEDSKGLNAAVVAEKTVEAEGFDCVICEKKFKTQKALNMHLVNHRPGVQVEETAKATEQAPTS